MCCVNCDRWLATLKLKWLWWLGQGRFVIELQGKEEALAQARERHRLLEAEAALGPLLREIGEAGRRPGIPELPHGGGDLLEAAGRLLGRP